MKAVIVYESMYGNTRTIAYAIGEGLRPTADVSVVSVGQAAPALLDQADLIIVGGPTHVHGMSRPGTRKAAVEAAGKPDSRLVLDPAADGPGVREWLADLEPSDGAAAAFDTRMNGPALFTGRAAKPITRCLRRRGFTLIARPESFLVTRDNKLNQGQTMRAQEWGTSLAARLATARVRGR